MLRRKMIKALAMGALTPPVIFRGGKGNEGDGPEGFFAAASYHSPWHEWPDMLWTGPEFWGNRLQDWRITDGSAECLVSDINRTLFSLTCQLSERREPFETTVTIASFNKASRSEKDYVGFRVGAVGRIEGYRSAAVFGQGLDAGITTDGILFIGEKKSDEKISVGDGSKLRLRATLQGETYTIEISLLPPGGNVSPAVFSVNGLASKSLIGNIGLVSHYGEENQDHEASSVRFSNWNIQGDRVNYDAEQTFGPVCFAQYTLHKNILKLTAQLAPIEAIEGHKVSLELKENDRWKSVQEKPVDPLSRVAHFRVENWTHQKDVPYRIRLVLPLRNRTEEHFYAGTIAREPLDAAQLKVAVFSCNADHGFPDAEVAINANKHKPHMALFLGDQFYESSGGFRIQTSPLEKAALDCLRKWYMFGWSYRDIFRHVPSAFLCDDHDVYHGNIWGEGGEIAPTDQGWGSEAQDQGGYKMPPEWVNMVQRMQTGHLPDPFDPTPIKQGISVYYTSWNYGGVSFALIEDRKFKSAPKNVLPEKADIKNGFIRNPEEFDIREYRDLDAELLGDRQMKFLETWGSDWRGGQQMKVVLSQTNFCTVDTLPAGRVSDSGTSRLPIPEPGEYVQGDAPTGNMDSNGWPQKGRDEALRVIRKCFAFHIAGDQHLASSVQYGIDEFGDAGYAFAGPALNNLHPRRFWPPANPQPLPGKPPYTGNFYDGFGNRMTVHAVANPRKTGRKPAMVYDRATGYGIVVFDKKAQTITTECWPRYVDPTNPETGGQYAGWPLTISVQDNYGRRAKAYLPEVKIRGMVDPVIAVVNEATGETEYVLRVKGKSFKPKVFSDASHTLRVGDPDKDVWKEFRNIRPGGSQKPLVCRF